MPCVAACCRMIALSQSLSDRPARRALSSAILRASGRTPLTLHEKSNFMPTPTSEVETPRAGLDSRGIRRVNAVWIRGSVLRPRPNFLPVTVNKWLTLLKARPPIQRQLSHADKRNAALTVIFSGRNTRMLPRTQGA